MNKMTLEFKLLTSKIRKLQSRKAKLVNASNWKLNTRAENIYLWKLINEICEILKITPSKLGENSKERAINLILRMKSELDFLSDLKTRMIIENLHRENKNAS